MRIFLAMNEAISTSVFEFSTLWPEVIFRYRDLTRLKNGKTGKIYYLFCIAGLSSLVLFLIQFSEVIDINHPVAKIMFGVFGLVMFPLIFGMFYYFSKKKYY